MPRRKPQATRPLYKVSWVDFNRDLQQAMQSFSVSDDIDQTVDSWYDILFSVLNKHAPPSVAGKKAGRLPCPWLTDELVCLVRERNALHKQVVRNPGNDEIRSQHIRARRKARQLDRRLRNEYFVRKCNSVPPHTLWSVINTVTGRVKSRSERQGIGHRTQQGLWRGCNRSAETSRPFASYMVLMVHQACWNISCAHLIRFMTS